MVQKDKITARMSLVSEQPQLSVNGPALHGQMCSKLAQLPLL